MAECIHSVASNSEQRHQHLTTSPELFSADTGLAVSTIHSVAKIDSASLKIR